MWIKRQLKQTLLSAAGRFGVLDRALSIATKRYSQAGELTILTYHGVIQEPLSVPDWCFLTGDLFARQLEVLGRHYLFMPLGEALSLLQEGLLPAKTRPVLVITFDDGYRGTHDVALPILRSFGAPATVFLNTGFLDGADTLWFCRLHDALSKTRKTELSFRGERLSLSSIDARANASARIQAALKEDDHDQLLAQVRTICTTLDVDPSAAVPMDSPFRMMSKPEVLALQRSGLVELGAHTHTHTILSKVSATRRQEEITLSMRQVEELTGAPCTCFAYPNGRPVDFDETDVHLLASLGATCAVTTVEKRNHKNSHPLKLCRYGVGGHMDAFHLAAHLLRS